MATTAQNSIPGIRTPLAWSLAMHAALIGTLALSNFLSRRGDIWGGGGGGAVSVGLVGNLPGVPLPRPEAMTTSRVVDTTRGLYKSEPARQPPQASEATPLPEFRRNKRPVSRPSRILEDPTPPPEGAIPYGQGGTPAMPYTQFTVGSGSTGGLNLGGPGGDFGGRFPWYVEAVRRRVSGNWLQSAVDPAIRFAPRCVVTFQILRDGSAANIELVKSSGVDSVDRSAVRAIRDSSPFERLPSEYSGGYVMVEFWFEFRRQ
jgi:protein TonB